MKKSISKVVLVLLIVALVVSIGACLLLFIEIRQLDWGLAANAPEEVTTVISEHLARPLVKTATKTETYAVTRVAKETTTEVTTEATTEAITEPTTETTTEATTEAISEESEEIEIHREYDYDQYELELLTRLIYWEAGDQGLDCQRAVGTVAMNRLERRWDGAYSLEKVIFAPGQYSCTWEYDYWTDYLDWGLYESCKENAAWVLSGGRYFGTEYVFQAQFEQGYDCFWLGSECFGKG